MPVAAVAATVALLTGCAGGVPSAPRVLEPAVVATPSPEESPCSLEDAVAGRVPDDFEPVGVYVCTIEMQVGEPTVLGGESAFPPPPPPLTGDLTPLLEALAEPSDPVSLGACPAIGFAGPTLRLVDADGRIVAVAYPATGCGMPKSDTYDRIEAALALLSAESGRPREGDGS